VRTIAEAARHIEVEIDRLDREWRHPGSTVRQMTTEEQQWALRQSIRCTFIELYGRDDGEKRWAAFMAAAERGALQ
jgi:hypothetical protein